MPLSPIIVEAHLQHRGMDFVGLFDQNSSNGYKYILTCTYYFTRCVEAIPTKKETSEVIVKLLAEYIVSRSGCRLKLTNDNAKAFIKIKMYEFCANYGIVLSHSSNYYPQGNGLAEFSNKNMLGLLKIMVGENRIYLV